MFWLVVMVLLHLLPQSSTLPPPGCKRTCGNIVVPFPFGMADMAGCFLEGFDLTCDESVDPPKLYLGNVNLTKTTNVQVLEMDLMTGMLRVNQWIARDCYYENGTKYADNFSASSLDLKQRPYKFSDSWNKFVAVGCDTVGYLVDYDGKFWSGCISVCNNTNYVINGTCSGIGCCQTNVPKGLRAFWSKLTNYYDHKNCSSFSPCSYAFLADDTFVFNTSIFMAFKDTKMLPVKLEWTVGNKSCEEAKKSSSGDYACVDEHSMCQNSTNGQGYRCICREGYRGNAYLEGGCEDINECTLMPNTTRCSHICINEPGSYSCSCPKGMYGDGLKDGNRCIDKSSRLTIPLGVGSCILFLVISISWLYWIVRKRNLMELREKFFRQNGGLLLQQQISPEGSFASATRIFNLDELGRATNNFDDSNIIGKGGFGTVYRGILLDKTVVAIKKSKISDQGQVEQFINEVVVLSNIIHRNVVKLLGCCLESEVPLLVYEFMSNGTLSDHLHDSNRAKLPLEMRLRIAAEAAEALAYLHSSASTPIIHRDVKSSNILLDENYTAKISDFGTSRLVPFDRSCLNSLVRGTFGYLDPEYFHTELFTDKSDVYSFGVVLVELLTGDKAITKTRLAQGNGSLANCFVSHMNQNRLPEILDKSIEKEESLDTLLEVATLAKRCLQVRGDDRPTMREVSMVLEGLRTPRKHPWIRDKNDVARPLIVPLLLSEQGTASFVAASGYGGEADSSYSDIVPLSITR